MADYIQSIDQTRAEIDAINRGQTRVRLTPRTIPEGEVGTVVTLHLSRPLSDRERDTLREQVIALADQIERGLIRDLRLERGVVAFKAYTGRQWRLVGEYQLRTDEVPEGQ